MKSQICKDYGRPGCLTVPDERFTMRFDDIGMPPILFCAFCGAEAKAIDAIIQKAFVERPGFAEDFKAAIEKHAGEKISLDAPDNAR